MEKDQYDEIFTLDSNSDSVPTGEVSPDVDFLLDAQREEEMFEEEDIWGNEYSHYDHLEAERKYFLGTPEQIRPVEDHPVLLVKFGHPELVWPGHKLKFEGEYSRFYRCNGESCYACKGDGKMIDWQLEFFLEVRTKKIGYLAFKKSNKPGSLSAVLGEAFVGGFPAVLSLQKSGMYNYKCSRIQPAADMDLGEKAIREFLSMLKADEINFDELVPSVTNARMLDAEGIGEKLAILGIRK